MKIPVFPAGDPRHLKILSTLGSEPLNQYGQQKFKHRVWSKLGKVQVRLGVPSKGV